MLLDLYGSSPYPKTGWSHFAQFTIAVVNKDPKKSKYSDTLHRFWKRDHDWGWKKFMEFSKLSDGFIESDTLIIKAQVQVIREKVDRPFCCLGRLYRKELVRTKQTGELDRRQSYVVKLQCFLVGVKPKCQTPNVQGEDRCDFESSCEALLYREVTSTLWVEGSRSPEKGNKAKSKLLDGEVKPAPIVRVEKDMFVLVGDVLVLLERAAALEPLQLTQNQSKQQNRSCLPGSCCFEEARRAHPGRQLILSAVILRREICKEFVNGL
ncbi:MATH domain-containing protein isoform X4 [Gossypium australe]|uniref:MATH domain-containing protein isoform X4 n=1 Tax=Gossypium australe TaxID=47621 RepID=A0A5B6VFF7_9ROSI|nr:MATH domain-containing protein isoform X4 [Gossypium australe]